MSTNTALDKNSTQTHNLNNGKTGFASGKLIRRSKKRVEQEPISNQEGKKIIHLLNSDDEREFFENYPTYDLDELAASEQRRQKLSAQRAHKKELSAKKAIVFSALMFGTLIVGLVLTIYKSIFFEILQIIKTNLPAILALSIFGLTFTHWYANIRKEFYTIIYKKFNCSKQINKKLVILQVAFIVLRFLLVLNPLTVSLVINILSYFK